VRRKPSRRSLIDYRAFVKHWTLADSRQEVASKLGISKASVNNLALRLTRAGVRLKELPHDRRQRNPIHVAELNQIIKEVE